MEHLQGDELRTACERAIILGYQQCLAVAHAVFVEAYRKLVWYIIANYRLQDEESANDVFQNVFQSLHMKISKPKWVPRGSFKHYVIKTAINACNKELKSQKTNLINLGDVPIENILIQQDDPANGDMELTAEEIWERLDIQLQQSNQNNLINRIILASRALEGRKTSKKYPAKKMLADWSKLAQLTDEQLARFHKLVSSKRRSFPSYGIVSLLEELLNDESIDEWQIAVVFMLAAGKNTTETRHLLARMSRLSEAAIHTRFCRYIPALQPPPQE